MAPFPQTKNIEIANNSKSTQDEKDDEDISESSSQM